MKTFAPKKNSDKNSLSAKPFFNKNSAEDYFSKSQESEQPFFSPYTLQPKLSGGKPNDHYEKDTNVEVGQINEKHQIPAPPIQRKRDEDETSQLKLQTENISPIIQKQSEEEKEAVQMQSESPLIDSGQQINGKNRPNRVVPVQLKEAKTSNIHANGIPQPLKSGLERISNFDLSGVQVHRNSPKPSQINAAAYTQGNEIHLGPGQEKHLPHEGWHVVQQMQNRVVPTMQAKGATINNDPNLEQEATMMGEKALQMVSLEEDTPLQKKGILSSPVIQRVGPATDAVRLIKANNSSTGATLLTEELVIGIRQAEDMFLKESPLDRLAESLGIADTVGPGQLGSGAITDVDRNFGSAITAFSSIYNAAPTSWEGKATDTNWCNFYIAAYLVLCINRAESTFHPAPPVMSNNELGVLHLGIAIYHGAFETIRSMRRRISQERNLSSPTLVTWAMVQEELRSGTATPGERELEQYTQLAEGSWEFDFDITARLPNSRRFQIQNGKLRVTILANYQNPTASGPRGTNYSVQLRRYVMASSAGGATGEGYEEHGSFSYVIGSRHVETWNDLPKGDYYLRIEKIEDTFSPDRLVGHGRAETMF
jgi:hypothetical protein